MRRTNMKMIISDFWKLFLSLFFWFLGLNENGSGNRKNKNDNGKNNRKRKWKWFYSLPIIFEDCRIYLVIYHRSFSKIARPSDWRRTKEGLGWAGPILNLGHNAFAECLARWHSAKRLFYFLKKSTLLSALWQYLKLYFKVWGNFDFFVYFINLFRFLKIFLIFQIWTTGTWNNGIRSSQN
jgi:hypothetical protein